jgi:AI-2 transport protein TqsA
MAQEAPPREPDPGWPQATAGAASPAPPGSAALRAVLMGAALVVIAAGLRMAAPVLVPLTTAVLIALVSLPMLALFARWRVPRALGVLLVLAVNAALLGFVAWIVVRSAGEIGERLPAYAVQLRQAEATALAWLDARGVDASALFRYGWVQPERLLEIATRLALDLTNVLWAAVVIVLFLAFLLLEAEGLPRKLHAAFGDRVRELRPLAPIAHDVQRYLVIKTLVSLVTGALVAIAATLVGVDFALFWGLLAFVMNFVPNIGSIAAGLPAVTLALLQLGVGPALVLLACYLVINMLLGNVLEPLVMGRELGLSTVVVLASLVFWGWVWGPVGMVLALPITMVARIVLENTHGYRWLAVLLGPSPPA